MTHLSTLRAQLAAHEATRPDHLKATALDAPKHLQDEWSAWCDRKGHLKTQITMAESTEENVWRDPAGNVVPGYQPWRPLWVLAAFWVLLFRTYAGFELTPEEMNALNNCKDYKNSPIPEDQRKPEDNSSMYSGSLTGLMAHIITSRTCFGFTTGGHTGEEVFLAAYHPQGTLPLGMNTNIELNEYLCNLFGLTHGNLEDLTSKNFARHTDVFEDYTCEIVPAADEKGSPTLIVKNKKDKKKQLTITPFSNIVKSGKKGQDEIRLNSVVVYVDKNNTFYLPASLVDFLK